MHHYQVKIIWTGNKGAGTFDYRSYSRNHNIVVEGKKMIEASSDSSFRGDAKRHNPEDLFVSSIAACHMLWYLHLCADGGVVVLSYEDQAEGTMVINEDGSGHFEQVVLRPVVVISPESDAAKAEALHQEAHKMCFIANSCNFEILHEPEVRRL